MITPMLPPPSPITKDDVIEAAQAHLDSTQRETAAMIRSTRRNPPSGAGGDKPTVRPTRKETP